METDVSVRSRIRHFFVNHCTPPRNQIALLDHQEAPSSSGRVLFTQEVDCMKLLNVCPEVGQALLTNTTTVMQTLCVECAALCAEAGQTSVTASNISIRLTHTPALHTSLPTLPPAKGQLVQVCGSIIRMNTKRVVPYSTKMMCPRCRETTESLTSPLDRAKEMKAQCANSSCKKEPLQVVGQVWMDYAECRLQQRSNQSGRLPRSILVTLDDELSSKCSVGQFVEVVGLLFPKWRHVFPTSRPSIEPTIWAINVLPMEAYRGAMTTVAAAPRRRGNKTERPKFNPEHFFASFCKDKRRRGVALVRSVCPHLSGLFGPRLAILLSALGGASTSGKTSMHIRSTIHCLFVGDPSTGKTQLLRFAAAVAPRSTSTTGMGSTSAGLTVAAAKEHGEWVLEPGALVLSDGGACIIDELRTVSPADRASLHEAMEQQTISVAKGGLVTKLRTACAVLSACNPPTRRGGRTEIGVGGPLLSRFDFIFLLWDTPQEDTDTRIATHMLLANTGESLDQGGNELTVDEVARYLWWVRSQYASTGGPLLSDPAADLLARYYEIQRRRGASPSLDDAVPVTIRLLESLVRQTQAHAKLHLQSVCSEEDAAMAVFLMERSAHSLKCPLYALGEGAYSSSKELDEIFLSDSEEAMAQQREVLEALVSVIRSYDLDAADEGRGSGGPQVGVNLPFLETYDGVGGVVDDDGQLGTVLSHRRQEAEALHAVTAAALSSVARLTTEVTHCSEVPRTVVVYPADDSDRSSSREAVAALLRSQQAPSSSSPSRTPAAPVEASRPSSVPPSSQRKPLTQEIVVTPLPAVEPEGDDVDDEEALLFSESEDDPAILLAQGSKASNSQTSLGSSRKRSAEEIMQSLRFSFH